MSELKCRICNRPVSSDPRSKYCGNGHKWRSWWKRSSAFAAEAERLPPATLPFEAEAVLPTGPDRILIAIQLALVGHAPAGAFGYRLGLRHGQSQIMRWFPSSRLSEVPVFLLEPFQWPAVPFQGSYVVVYMDRQVRPIGGPRFTIPVAEADPRTCYSLGDRTYKPRPKLLLTDLR